MKKGKVSAAVPERLVSGFLFSHDLNRVMLVRCAIGGEHAGFLAGLSAVIREQETPEVAMSRILQSVGCSTVPVSDWSYFAQRFGDNKTVEFVCGQADLRSVVPLGSDAKVEIVPVMQLHPLRKDVLEEVSWLVAIAVNHLRHTRPAFVSCAYIG